MWVFSNSQTKNLKLLVNIEKYQICQGAPLGGASYLQEMVEKVLILRATPAAQLGARGLGVLREYALLISSQGQFKDALGFLSEGSNEADSELIDRLKSNTGEKPQKQQPVLKQQQPQQQQQQQQQTSGRYKLCFFEFLINLKIIISNININY